MQHRTLVRLMGLSVAAIALEATAAAVTGSVGFLSDAMESMVDR